MAACRHLCLERLCHFLFQLGSISIRHASAAALQALTERFHLAVLAGNGVVRVLEGTEQECDVLALTDAVIHPAGVFNPIVHNANHHIGSLWIVHGQKEPAGGGCILLVKAAHGLTGGMGLIHHPAQRQDGCGIYFCFKHNSVNTFNALFIGSWLVFISPINISNHYASTPILIEDFVIYDL